MKSLIASLAISFLSTQASALSLTCESTADENRSFLTSLTFDFEEPIEVGSKFVYSAEMMNRITDFGVGRLSLDEQGVQFYSRASGFVFFNLNFAKDLKSGAVSYLFSPGISGFEGFTCQEIAE